jgi:hypothetical protein
VRVPSVFASPLVRIAGVVLIASAVALALVLVFAGGDNDGDDPEDTMVEAGPMPEPRETGDGWLLTPVGWAPQAQALASTGDDVYATDTTDGTRYDVLEPRSDQPTLAEPEPFGAVSRLDRAVPAPSGADLWVAEGSNLLRLDASGDVQQTIVLEYPSSIAAVTDDAVWLTVSGLPVADESGINAPRSVVQRVDAATGAVIAVPVDDPIDFHLAVADDEVWATVGSTLLQLDPATVEPRTEVALAGPASALVIDDGEVLAVVGGSSPQVFRVDRADLATTASIALEAGSVGEAALVQGDSGTELWVLRPDGDEIDRVALGSGDTRPLELVEPRRIEVTDDGVWLLGGEGDGLVLVARPSS